MRWPPEFHKEIMKGGEGVAGLKDRFREALITSNGYLTISMSYTEKLKIA